MRPSPRTDALAYLLEMPTLEEEGEGLAESFE